MVLRPHLHSFSHAFVHSSRQSRSVGSWAAERSVSGRGDVERDFTRSASPSLRGSAPRRSASMRSASSFSREQGGGDAGGRPRRTFGRESFTDEYRDSPSREGYAQRPSRRRRSFFSGRHRDEIDDEVREYTSRSEQEEDESYLEGGDDEGASNQAGDISATTVPTTAAGAQTDGNRTSLFGRLFDMGFPSRDGRMRSIANLLSPSRFTRRYEKNKLLTCSVHAHTHIEGHTYIFACIHILAGPHLPIDAFHWSRVLCVCAFSLSDARLSTDAPTRGCAT